MNLFISGLILFLFISTSYAEASPVALFKKYCFDCHSDGVEKGDLGLDILFKASRRAPKNRAKWHKTWEVIEKEQMPPADRKSQPTGEEREIMMIAIEQAVYNVNREKEYPGKVSLVRMSNQQYSNTISSISGVKKDYAKMLPLDPPSAGFDNIGTSLSLSSNIFEYYQRIAADVSREMFDLKTKFPEAKKKVQELLKISADGKDVRKTVLALKIFSTYVFRRPASNTELKELYKVYQAVHEKDGHRRALQEVVRSMLVSPNFIFRTELLYIDKNEGGAGRLNEFALASRLSYFLWNSAPDRKLLEEAAKKGIRANIQGTVRRMIRDPRFKQMVDSFGTYWLGIQYLENNVPNKKLFRFDEELLPKMKEETSHFLKYLIVENKPLNDLFTSRETFVDAELAKHYGISFKGKGFAKVTTPESHKRRGILSQPSVLIASSDPNRTSVVKRGQWLLETILGMPPPPAPAAVPGLEEAGKGQKNLSLRERLQIHREDKKCASCHEMMDPLGLAMDNYDAIGRWRTTENGKAIDVRTEWRGNKIETFDDLYGLLTGKYRDKFLKCLSEKILTYALGRGLEVQDRIAITRIVEKIQSKDSRFQDLIMAVIESTPFQYRKLGM